MKNGIRSETEILAGFSGESQPLVSLVCVSYNHAPFIEQTLDGFLIQETSFPFEIICFDDFSSDRTRDIIQDYATRYPRLVRTILPESNQRSLGLRAFPDFVAPACRGKYIARCEGDDYWTDPFKIQKQVAFLEDNPDFVLVTHDLHSVDEKGGRVSAGHLPDFYKRDFSAEELRRGWAGPVTQSILFRNVVREFPPEFHRSELGDVFLASMLGQHGGAKYLADIQPSVYRLHPGGIFSPLSERKKNEVQINTFFWISRYYQRLGQMEEARVFRIRALEKGLRHTSLSDVFRLLLMRLAGLNVKKVLGG